MTILYADTRTGKVMTIKLQPSPGATNIAVVAPDGDCLALSISKQAIGKVLKASTLKALITRSGWVRLTGKHLGTGGGAGWYCGKSGFSAGKNYDHVLKEFLDILREDSPEESHEVTRKIYHPGDHDRY
jgi:hypothetical protein